MNYDISNLSNISQFLSIGCCKNFAETSLFSPGLASLLPRHWHCTSEQEILAKLHQFRSIFDFKTSGLWISKCGILSLQCFAYALRVKLWVCHFKPLTMSSQTWLWLRTLKSSQAILINVKKWGKCGSTSSERWQSSSLLGFFKTSFPKKSCVEHGDP